MFNFGSLLRQHRTQQRMTQETLAERSGLSSRSIGETERGRRIPRQQTVEQLADALGLTGDTRATFLESVQIQRWSTQLAPTRHAPAPVARTSGPVPEPPDLSSGPSVPRQLPGDLPDFVGRTEELQRLVSALDPANGGNHMVSISGATGMGKTALAVHLAHRIAAWYPDGQLYVPLGGSGPGPLAPADVLAHLLRSVTAADYPGYADPALRGTAFRAALADKQVLLVLDDAAGYTHLAPLLATGRSAVVITSRLPLTGLPVAATVNLRSLPVTDSLRLLSRIADERRILEEGAAATELVHMCGGHPLAIRILGARLAARPDWTVGGLRGQLADEQHRLDELRHGDLAVRPALEQVYRRLTPAAARAFALLGGLPVHPFPEWVSTVLLGLDRPAGSAVLQELLDTRLLEPAGLDGVALPRYRFHEVVRLLARERHAGLTPHERRAAFSRLVEAGTLLARVAHEHLRQAGTGGRDSSDEPRCAERMSELVARRPRAWFAADREVLSGLVEICDATELRESAGVLHAKVVELQHLLDG
ncbi:helix-turn-helix domain-containing protein [Plantactinospora sonchi]|uniref:Helix-turn-helix domain-containing protein n=1 Tax=Plantactinospora sonchi TaxID=1544735 RepID=A0ABU7S0H1_9ACTN